MSEENTPVVSEQVKDSPLKYGYTVGINEDGGFRFEIHGQEAGLIELLGIHQYADYRISFIQDINQKNGVPALALIMKSHGETLKTILDILTEKGNLIKTV